MVKEEEREKERERERERRERGGQRETGWENQREERSIGEEE